MRLRQTVLLVTSACAMASCGMDRSSVAYGTPTSIIVIATDQVWESLGDSLRTALEPVVFTLRDERAFDVTHVVPNDPRVSEYRKFRQVLVIGRPDDPWVAPAVGRAKDAPVGLPALLEVDDVWAFGQHVTAIALDPQSPPSAGLPVFGDVRRGVDERFRFYMLQRMYVSGVNEDLAERLREESGFSLILPRVYREVPAEGVRIFKNDLPDPWILARYVQIEAVGGARTDVTTEELLDWRDSVVTNYPRRMITVRDPLIESTLEGGVLEVQGRWQTPEPDPDSGETYHPGGGAFISRVVSCAEQDRTYFIDSWLYAPGKDKLEYVMQLRTILGTFECGGATAAPAEVALRSPNGDDRA
ncbi:MAG: DUF4837 family protein [Gemmatimonadota bacterium]